MSYHKGFALVDDSTEDATLEFISGWKAVTILKYLIEIYLLKFLFDVFENFYKIRISNCKYSAMLF